jgi:hypothetical protein
MTAETILSLTVQAENGLALCLIASFTRWGTFVPLSAIML